MNEDFEAQFEGIRADRQNIFKSKVSNGLTSLMTEIYPNKVHFIYELLQNADDAGATQVYFKLSDDRLIFSHTGTKQFDAKDVDSITSIGDSTKSDNYISAGKFGIGFKSVYSFTGTPEIHCDTIDFKIEKMLLPTKIPPLEGRLAGETVFVLPKCNDDAEKLKNFALIKKGLADITPDTLLFLNNIKVIRYTVNDSPLVQYTKSVDGNLVSIITTGNKLYKWRLFSKKVTLNDKPAHISIAFTMKIDKDGVSFVKDHGNVCIMFPTHITSGLCFSINAPFGCPPSRDTINIDDKDNEVLRDKLAHLVAEALVALKKNGQIDESLFAALYPQEGEYIPSFYLPLQESVRTAFNENALLMTVDNKSVMADNAIMVSEDVRRKILTLQDVQKLWGESNLSIIPFPQNKRARLFLDWVGVKTVDTESVLDKIINMAQERGTFLEWLKSFGTERLTKLYAWISTEASSRAGFISMDNGRRLQVELALKLVPWILCEDGDFCSAEDVVILMDDVPVPEGKKAAHKEVISNAGARKFFVACGVSEYGTKEYEADQQKMIQENFCDWLESVSKNRMTEKSAPNVAKRILNYLEKNSDAEQNIYFNRYSFVFAERSNYGKVWTCPCNCCIDEPYEATGLAAADKIHGKFVVSPIYEELPSKKKEAWIQFLKRHGALCDINAEDKYFDTGYKSGWWREYKVEFLSQYLALQNKNLNLLIWHKFMAIGGWDDKYKQGVKQLNQRYEMKFYTAEFITLLCNTPWIPNKKGKMLCPRDVLVDDLDRDFSVYNCYVNPGFLDAIGFASNEKARLQQKAAQEESTRRVAATLGIENADEVTELMKLLNSLKKDNMSLKEVMQLLKEKREAENAERARHEHNINEALKKKSARSQSPAKGDDDEFTNQGDYDDEENADNREVANVARRSQKLSAQMEEAGPSTDVGIYRRQQIDPRERQFLQNEYGGKCQICDTKIIKRNGEPYFEATNLLDFSELKKEYNAGVKTGWNSLCLCPNCAARWKYQAVDLFDFKEQAKETEIQDGDSDIQEFAIQMQGEERLIKYTPRHLLSLQAALKYFDESEV